MIPSCLRCKGWSEEKITKYMTDHPEPGPMAVQNLQACCRAMTYECLHCAGWSDEKIKEAGIKIPTNELLWMLL